MAINDTPKTHAACADGSCWADIEAKVKALSDYRAIIVSSNELSELLSTLCGAQRGFLLSAGVVHLRRVRCAAAERGLGAAERDAPGDSSQRSGPGLKGARGVLSVVSWPWVPACGSLEPPCRDGENAQKTGKNGEKMGKIQPKTCEGRELAKNQLDTTV